MKPEQHKDENAAQRNAVTISREFDFPREAVFKMVTDPKTAPKFFSPEGAVKDLFEWDPRPGGAIRIHDRQSDGTTGRTSGTFVEFVAPERFSFRSTTTMSEGPATFTALQSMTFEKLGERRTRVTVSARVVEAGAFPGGAEGLEGGYMGGWGQTFDMLERALRANPVA